MNAPLILQYRYDYAGPYEPCDLRGQHVVVCTVMVHYACHIPLLEVFLSPAVAGWVSFLRCGF
ncbi:MAG: hypothetical protein QM235_02325 [Pseudomonadota bacterium]|nr:hypothetical protein [Pseudomonadota bacterium]